METSWVIGGSVALLIAAVLLAVGIWYIYKSPSINSLLSEPGSLQSLSATELNKLKEEEKNNNTISTAMIIAGVLIGGPVGVFFVSQGVLRR